MTFVRHDPTNHATERHGCWVTCTCGWRSATWTTIAAAHANFGRHLTLIGVITPIATAIQEETDD